jgi:hypothetical protein
VEGPGPGPKFQNSYSRIPRNSGPGILESSRIPKFRFQNSQEFWARNSGRFQNSRIPGSGPRNLLTRAPAGLGPGPRPGGRCSARTRKSEKHKLYFLPVGTTDEYADQQSKGYASRNLPVPCELVGFNEISNSPCEINRSAQMSAPQIGFQPRTQHILDICCGLAVFG